MTKDIPKVAAQPGVAKCLATKDEEDNGRLRLPKQGRDAGPAGVPQERQTSRTGGDHTEVLRQLGLQNVRQKLLVMQGRPCKLFVDPMARPFAIHKHRPVAIHW